MWKTVANITLFNVWNHAKRHFLFIVFMSVNFCLVYILSILCIQYYVCENCLYFKICSNKIAFLPAATKLGQGNVFTGVCDSVHMGGVCLSACWDVTPPPRSRHPLEQTPPPGADTPRSRHAPRTRPPRADTPHQSRHPPEQTPPQD